MIDLNKVLVNKKLFTGPPTSKTLEEAIEKEHWVNNSTLSDIKRTLLAEPGFLGDEKHLVFGSEVHLQYLLKKRQSMLTFDEESRMKQMWKAMDQHKLIQQFMDNSDKEQMLYKEMYGVYFRGTLDLRGIGRMNRKGADFKTTSAKTEKQFLHSALNKFDYPRQGWCYEQLADLDEFYFFGLQKYPPFNIYTLKLSDYAKEKQKQANEAKFLIEFFKTFGRPKLESSQDSERT